MVSWAVPRSRDLMTHPLIVNPIGTGQETSKGRTDYLPNSVVYPPATIHAEPSQKTTHCLIIKKNPAYDIRVNQFSAVHSLVLTASTCSLDYSLASTSF